MQNLIGKIKSGRIPVFITPHSQYGKTIVNVSDVQNTVGQVFDLKMTSTVLPKAFLGDRNSIGDVFIAIAPLGEIDFPSSKQKYILVPIVLSHISRDAYISYHFRDRDIEQTFIDNYDTRIHNLVISDVYDKFDQDEIGFEFGRIYGCFIMFPKGNENLKSPICDDDLLGDNRV